MQFLPPLEPFDEPPMLGKASHATQLVELTLASLTNWRWSWRSSLVYGVTLPVATCIGARVVFGTGTATATRSFIAVVLLSLLFETKAKLGNHLLFARFEGMLDYVATLGAGRAPFVVATITAFVLLAIPSLVVTIAAAWLLLAAPVHVHPLAPVVLLLAFVPVSAAGAAVASLARSDQDGHALQALTTFAMLGPVPTILGDRTPGVLRAVAVVNPASYAASAVEQTLVGRVTGQLALDALGLVVSGVVLVAVAARALAPQRRRPFT